MAQLVNVNEDQGRTSQHPQKICFQLRRGREPYDLCLQQFQRSRRFETTISLERDILVISCPDQA